MSKFLEFKQYRHTKLYNVNNKKTGETLGQIYYESKWYKWVFFSIESEFIYDVECLKDIIKFMEKL